MTTIDLIKHHIESLRNEAMFDAGMSRNEYNRHPKMKIAAEIEALTLRLKELEEES